MARLGSVCIGYLFGMILTAELVVHIRTGKSARDFGTGNPGMANVMAQFGFAFGAVVLLGDLLKTILACLLAKMCFRELGELAVLYAGLGTVLGHNFPVWKRGKGGKGVAVSCMTIVLCLPGWGFLANLIGFAVVLVTGYLPLGAVLIPLSFIPFAFWKCGMEAGILSAILFLLMVTRHYRGLRRICHGEEKQIHLIALVREKLTGLEL